MARLVCLALVALTLLGVPAFAAGTRASLTLENGKVRGTHFHPRERVHVTIGSAVLKRITVRASRLGTFTVNTAPATDRCTSGIVVVVAVGATGDTARLKLPSRMCPVP